jgi:hypothetical protein
MVPSRRSWIQDRTIGNFSGACFSASLSNVVKKVRHLATKSLICASVNFGACCAATVWRTTGCATNLVGKIGECCCWLPGVEGSKRKEYHSRINFLMIIPLLIVGEYWSFGDNCDVLFAQTVWGVNWFCVWLSRTILVGVPLNMGCWIMVPFCVFVWRIFCVELPILLTDWVNNNVA